MHALYQNNHIAIWQTAWHGNNPYDDNYALHVQDNPATVLLRRAKLLFNLPVDALVWLNQVHGNLCVPAQLGINPIGADALYTDQARIGLCIMTADCVPIALFDTERIACVHAGWQGLSQGVIASGVANLKGQISAYIGAAISQSCYELPKELAHKIVQQCQVDERFITKSTDNDKVYLDIVGIARHQLTQLGVQILNNTAPCTYSQNYHSHRRATHQGSTSGRMAMIIAKKPSNPRYRNHHRTICIRSCTKTKRP